MHPQISVMERPRHTTAAPDPADPPLALASAGSGPLLQRDYWGVIDGCRLSPREIIDLLAARFGEVAPPELVRFERADGAGTPLSVGDELTVKIFGAGTYAVRVLHRDELSLTVGTVRGHPEAGRITFGAYPNARGDVVFHIRSRARSSSRQHYWGFLTAGEPMQTNTWADFINRLAAMAGDGVIGFLHAETREVEPEPDEDEPKPTFLARSEPTPSESSPREPSPRERPWSKPWPSGAS